LGKGKGAKETCRGMEVKYYYIISSKEKMGQWDSSIAYPIDKMMRLCGKFSDHKYTKTQVRQCKKTSRTLRFKGSVGEGWDGREGLG